MSHYLHRCTMRFPRTEAEAFKDHTYAVAVEHYRSPGYGLGWWLAFSAVSFAGAVVIAVTL